jgi:hypothetical protein
VNTPSILIDLCAGAGREIDRRFPGLREQDHYAWLRKVVWLLKTTGEAQNNPYHFGLKSAHGPNQAISGDTIGILSPGSIAETGRRDFYAVSIIRHNPPTNEWRIPLPLDYGMVSGQWWIEPTQRSPRCPSSRSPTNRGRSLRPRESRRSWSRFSSTRTSSSSSDGSRLST